MDRSLLPSGLKPRWLAHLWERIATLQPCEYLRSGLVAREIHHNIEQRWRVAVERHRLDVHEVAVITHHDGATAEGAALVHAAAARGSHELSLHATRRHGCAMGWKEDRE